MHKFVLALATALVVGLAAPAYAMKAWNKSKKVGASKEIAPLVTHRVAR